MNILHKILIPLATLLTVQGLSQVNSDTGFSADSNKKIVLTPDILNLTSYYDSLYTVHKQNLLVGCVFSIFNEVSSNSSLLVSFDGLHELQISTDLFGRFFITPPTTETKSIKISVNDEEFKQTDTIIKWGNLRTEPLRLKVIPRYKVLLRGRTFEGSTPKEGVDIEVVHDSDTFRIQTLSCYTDDEDYWNCLYLGMFKQSIYFDNPDDSISIKTSALGFENNYLSLKCSNYNGTIIPIQLKYSDKLANFPKHNISLRIAPPFRNEWLVGLDYMFNSHKVKRIAVGISFEMLISEFSTEFRTFYSNVNGADSNYIMSSFDTAYISIITAPKLLFWITNPEKRKVAIYTGVESPYMFPQNKIYLHGFIGGRFYLDLNKALLVELRYINYDLNLTKYTFNPYGNSFPYQEQESFNKLLVNIGLLVSF